MKLLSTIVLLICLLAATNAQARKVVCYFESWAIYRPAEGSFGISNIDPYLCTHYIYAFVDLNENGTVKINDPYNDIDLGGFVNFNNLRNINPSLKTLIAIGGWNANSTIYSMVFADPILRTTFVDDVYAFVKLYNFSGLDLDWEYPAQRGGAPEDKANFVLLISELRAKFSPDGLLLSAAVGANVTLTTTSYDVPQLAQYLDFINLMTYDFHGNWDNVTGIHNGLHAATNDDPNLNTETVVRHWLSQGATIQKLVMGIPLYGQTFTLENSNNYLLYSPTTGGGNPGTYTQSEGFLAFYEVCKTIIDGGWTEVWEINAEVPFMFQGNQWVSWENYESARRKAEFARILQLSGTMVWAIDNDDFRDTCGLGVFPLTNIIKSTFYGGKK